MGFMPLPGTTFVLNFLRTVSAGKPNISTSTNVPMRRSDKHCPEITCNHRRHITTSNENNPYSGRGSDLDLERPGDDSVDSRLGEEVEASVFAPHEVWFEKVATATVVLEQTEVELHSEV